MITLLEKFNTPLDRETCFNYIADFSKVCEWDPQIESCKRVTDGPIGIGSRFHLKAKLFGRVFQMDYLIVEYEYPSHLVLEGVGRNGFKAVDRISFAESKGGTTVDYKAEFTFVGSDSLLKPILKAFLQRTGSSAISGLSQCLGGNFAGATKSPCGPAPVRVLEAVGDRLLLPGMLGFSTFGYRLRKRHFPPIDQRLDGKTAIITGATSGIGEGAALALAELGARVLVVGRNKGKLTSLVKELEKRTGRSEFEFFLADLSEVGDIQRVSKEISAKFHSVDLLIHNAGALERKYSSTKAGYERSFAVNLLAPFLLTRGLMDQLKRGSHARVIFVSSGGMYPVKLNVDELNLSKDKFDGVRAYAQAKRAQVILAEELGKSLRKDQIVVHSMHPGWVDTAGVSKSLPKFYALTKPILRTIEQGVDTISWLSAAREPGKSTGKFWHDRRERSTNLIPRTKETDATRKQLIDFLTGFETN
jgi:NAD(P)-dependent dehydrogenase (short-subunit alcohol dehydrogenase family)